MSLLVVPLPSSSSSSSLGASSASASSSAPPPRPPPPPIPTTDNAGVRATTVRQDSERQDLEPAVDAAIYLGDNGDAGTPLLGQSRECVQRAGGHGAAAGDGATMSVPPAVVVAHSAGGSAALLRLIGKGMQFHAPQAKRALAACLLDPPVERRTQPGGDNTTAAQVLTISVEAFGSGVVIVPALQVDRDVTVSALKARIAKRCVSSGAIRLFVGHGGEELAVDARSLRTLAVPDGAALVLLSILPRETLSRLFGELCGSGWRRSAGWGSSSTAPLSAWHGVACSEAGAVVTLRLDGNLLHGACTHGSESSLASNCGRWTSSSLFTGFAWRCRARLVLLQ